MAYVLCIILFVLVLILFDKYNQLKRHLKQHDLLIEQLLDNKEVVVPYRLTKQNKPISTPMDNRPIGQKQEIQPKDRKEKKELESIFGKQVLSFLAAILVFIGLIAFGALIFAKMSNIVKVMAMFIFSIVVTAFGFYLCKKRNSVLSESIMGCGIGSIFISTFVAHLYFNVFSSTVAFAMIFIWAVIVFKLADKLRSKTLLYIVHVGCIISVLLSTGYGKLETQLFEIVLYQCLIIGLLLIMDNKFSRQLFKIMAFLSMLANSLLAIECSDQLYELEPKNAPMLLLLATIVLVVYSFIIHIFASRKYIKNPVAELIVSNFAIIVNMNILISAIDNIFKTSTMLNAVLSTVLYIAIIAGLIVVINAKLPLKISILASMSHLAFLYIDAADTLSKNYFVVPGVIVFVIVSLLLYKKTKDNTYFVFSYIFLTLDMIASISIMKTTCSFIYSLVLLLFSFVIIKIVDDEKYMDIQLMLSCLFLNLYNTFTLFSFIDDIVSKTQNDIYIIIGFAIMILSNVAFKLYIEKRDDLCKITKIISKITTHIWLFASSLSFIWLYDEQSNALLICLFLLSVLAFFVGMLELPEVIDNNDNSLLGVWYGFKFTWFLVFPITQFTTILEEQMLFSILFMVIASICVLFGFKYIIKSIRIYGLVILLASVLKIGIIDVWGKESIIRVVTLFVAAFICFFVSAIYTKLENKEKELLKTTE